MANNYSFTISDLAKKDIESPLQYISEELKNGKASRDLIYMFKSKRLLL